MTTDVRTSERERSPLSRTIGEASDVELLAALVARRAGRGGELRERRIAAQLGLSEAARKIGINHGYLGRVERGIHVPSRDVQRRMARVYGCKLSELFKPVFAEESAAEASAA